MVACLRVSPFKPANAPQWGTKATDYIMQIQMAIFLGGMLIVHGDKDIVPTDIVTIHISLSVFGI